MKQFADPIEWEDSLPIRPSSPAWRVTIKALYGSPLNQDELKLFRQLAEREPPEGGSDEFLAVVGRRGGKSETTARLAVFEACHGGHQVALAPGQLGLIPIISPRREQSGEIVRYAHGLCRLPQVAPFVEGDPLREGVRFRTGIEIRTMTADAVAVSGPTVVCAVRDELARFPGDESVMPDTEIDASLRPTLAPVRGAPRRRLIGITSAYIRNGIAFETEQEHFGRDDADVLVVRGASNLFNPALDFGWLERERRRVGDQVFAREYLAEWTDAAVDGWFASEDVELAVQAGHPTIPWPGNCPVVIAADPSFAPGTSDKFGWAVASSAPGYRDPETGKRGPRQVIVWECGAWKVDRKPRAMARRLRDEVCKRYQTRRITIDQHSAHAFLQLCSDVGLRAHIVNWTPGEGLDSKTQRYRNFRLAMQSGDLSLPDSSELVRDLHRCRGLLLPGGQERVYVPRTRRGHGDCLSATVMAATEAMRKRRGSGMLGVLAEMNRQEVQAHLRSVERALETPYYGSQRIDLGDVGDGKGLAPMSAGEWKKGTFGR